MNTNMSLDIIHMYISTYVCIRYLLDNQLLLLVIINQVNAGHFGGKRELVSSLFPADSGTLNSQRIAVSIHIGIHAVTALLTILRTLSSTYRHIRSALR